MSGFSLLAFESFRSYRLGLEDSGFRVQDLGFKGSGFIIGLGLAGSVQYAGYVKFVGKFRGFLGDI